MSKNAHRAAMRTLAEETLAVLHEIRDRMPERRPESCCGDCPPIVGGGYDCTCDERCGRPETVTVTLPRDVVWRSVVALYEAAGAFRYAGNFAEAGRTDEAGHTLAEAYNDAQEADDA